VWRDGDASPVSLTRSVLHWRRPPTPPSNPPLSRSRLQSNALLISSPCDIAAFPTAIAFISLALSHSLSLSTSLSLDLSTSVCGRKISQDTHTQPLSHPNLPRNLDFTRESGRVVLRETWPAHTQKPTERGDKKKKNTQVSGEKEEMRCACCKKRTERGFLSQEKRRQTRKASTRGVFVMRDSPSGAFFEIWFDCFGGRRRCGSKVWPDRACRTIWPKTPPTKSRVLLATAHLCTYMAHLHSSFSKTLYRTYVLISHTNKYVYTYTHKRVYGLGWNIYRVYSESFPFRCPPPPPLPKSPIWFSY
jgi:hypothetical protein